MYSVTQCEMTQSLLGLKNDFKSITLINLSYVLDGCDYTSINATKIDFGSVSYEFFTYKNNCIF